MRMPIRSALPREIPLVGETFARAFEADPMFRFLLPEERTRLSWLRFIMDAMVAMAAPDGCVLTSEGDGVPAAIALSPPGKYPTPYRRLVGHLLRPKSWSAGAPTRRIVVGSVRLLVKLDQKHVDGRHWYVQTLGVHPSHQGTGLGKELLEAALARADRDALPTYLETSNPKNLGFYRRFGFEVTWAESLSGGYPPLWGMLRAARG